MQPLLKEDFITLPLKFLSDTGEEGWWIPQYLADANPDIVTVEDALARP
ncbi:MAG: hypothetical protein CM15mP70_11150 [Pelagibacteraceae bacterium]|nr:MAG: hypothetical protein CM15mP70_11150 [Pelagibacteraceae bacterium]